MLKVANSVINASMITGVLPVANGGTGVTTSTGTGNTVLSASPTLSGDVNLSTGNLVIGTSGKGIDFSITTHPAGMTSELLADYEEGTWTPTDIGGSLVVVGTFSSSGTYTKIGKVVTVSGTLNGTTSVAITGGANVVCGGLPYSAAAGTLCAGNAVNAAANATASLYANSNVNVGSVTAMTATATIYFSITYLA